MTKTIDNQAPCEFPHTDNKDYIFEKSQYFSLEHASEIIKCKPADLIHLGATGSIELMAAVVSPAVFSWPDPTTLTLLPELKDFIYEIFDEKDRLIVWKDDISKLEALGWCAPAIYFNAEKAAASFKQALIDNFSFSDDSECKQLTQVEAIAVIGEREGWSAEIIKEFQESASKPSILDNEEKKEQIRKSSFNTPWYFSRRINRREFRTTAKHLFLSKDELLRIQSKSPKSADAETRELIHQKPPHGNEIRHAKNREEVLLVMVDILRNRLDKNKKAPDLTKMMEIDCLHYWPDGSTPLKFSVIEKLLAQARKLRLQS